MIFSAEKLWWGMIFSLNGGCSHSHAHLLIEGAKFIQIQHHPIQFLVQRKFKSDAHYGQLDCGDHVKNFPVALLQPRFVLKIAVPVYYTPKQLCDGARIWVLHGLMSLPFTMHLSPNTLNTLALLGMNP